MYLHSTEVRDLLVLILSKFKIHVAAFTLSEFLAYIYYKYQDYSILDKAMKMLHDLYVVETIDKEVVIRASLIIADLVTHGNEFNIVDVYNVSIATLRNLPILTDDPMRYYNYVKYNVSTISIEEFIDQFRKSIKA
ncbi:MAG: hypothetical protein QXE81_05120 [Desulfurococcaceae archaeon]